MFCYVWWSDTIVYRTWPLKLVAGRLLMFFTDCLQKFWRITALLCTLSILGGKNAKKPAVGL